MDGQSQAHPMVFAVATYAGAMPVRILQQLMFFVGLGDAAESTKGEQWGGMESLDHISGRADH